MTKALMALMLMVIPTTAWAVHLTSLDGKHDLETTRVAYIRGPILPDSTRTFVGDLQDAKNGKGDLLIVINSGGGMVRVGEEILEFIEAEKATGRPVWCYVSGYANSMAFNILTKCTVRIAAPKARCLVHKVAVAECDPSNRLTAKRLRSIADDLDKSDEPYRQANAKAMGLSLKDYDMYADQETYWLATTLLARHYLDALAVMSN